MRIHYIATHLLCALALGGLSMAAPPINDAETGLVKGFAAPPDSAAPRTWWHWLNGNVTKEGVTADLESMQRVGIRAATIVVMADGPNGPVRFRSPAFYEMVKFAATEAKRLGIALGLENCSGWSSSGGPWVTPENSMQTVVSSEVTVAGPAHLAAMLPQPETRKNFYRDIRVVAFPALEGDVPMASLLPTITASVADFRDPKRPGGFRLPAATPQATQYLQFEFAQPLAARTLQIDLTQIDNGSGKIEVSDDGQNFQAVRSFNIRKGSGMQTYALTPTAARFYRILFSTATGPGNAAVIPSVNFMAAARLDNCLAKRDGTDAKLMEAEEFDSGNTPTPPDSMVVHADKTLDLTSWMDATGRLTWEVPLGKWTVVRTGYTTTGVENHPGPPEGLGLECDKLSRPAARAFWDGLLTPVTKELGPLTGTAFTHTLIDSYEVGNQNWSAEFPQEFKKRRGYDLLRYLPVLTGRIVESPDVSERILWDMRRTIADLFADNYFGYFAQLAHKAGITLEVEPYGNGPFDAVLSGRDADRVMGEFWWPSGDMGSLKIASSVAHTYGKQIVGAETFTESGSTWDMSPPTLKALGDRAFTCGINAYTFHRFVMQPWLNRWPGMNMGANGSNLERTNTWWEQGKAWLQYVARCQYLLQQGLFVGDVLFFTGEGSPSGQVRPAKTVLPEGYDFDNCNTDVILHRLAVKDGNLVLPDGTTYRALVLSNERKMTPAFLRKIKELADDGATILGQRPEQSPSLTDYPQCDAEVKELAAELWDSGKIVSGKTLPEVLAGLKIRPDFESSEPTVKFLYLHRRIGSDDLYFISNQTEMAQVADGLFRVSGKRPEFWRADTGKIEKVAAYSEEDGRTRIPLRLDPSGSVFVLFRNEPPPANHPVALARADEGGAAPVDTLVIRKAVYGVAPVNGVTDASQSADVTARLAALVQKGALHVEVSTAISGNDPAIGKKKQLEVDYTLNGEPGSKIVHEAGNLDIARARPLFPDAQLRVDEGNQVKLEAWKDGAYTVKMADGESKSIPVTGLAQPLELSGPWVLNFPPNWGAPDQTTLDKLISWNDSPDTGVKYFSGTATYQKTISIPAGFLGTGHHLYLDLGDVHVIAQVMLNDRDLGILWKPPYGVEITGAAHEGDNVLQVKVTNLWRNRMVGDEQLPEDSPRGPAGTLGVFPQWVLDGKASPTGRFTFTSARHWNKSSPLLPSGMIGPVMLRPSVDATLP